MLLVAREADIIAGIIVSTLYFRYRFFGINFSPFRIQVNGGVLISEKAVDRLLVLEKLLIALNRFADRRVEATEFRNFTDTGEFQSAFAKQGYIFRPHLNLVKPLSTVDEAWATLSQNRRRQIRKALRYGTRTEPASETGQVKAFYEILTTLYRQKIHKKVPSLDTFLEFFHRGKQHGDGVIMLVFVGEKVIGGIVCPIEPGKVMYEWYVCGLDKAYRDHYPSVMATWGAIAWACGQNLPAFDFMGLGKPDIPYGVRDFKLRFGGETHNYGRYFRDSL